VISHIVCDVLQKEACAMALELLVNVYRLPLDRLYFTYFSGEPSLSLQPDMQVRDIWRQLGYDWGQVELFSYLL